MRMSLLLILVCTSLASVSADPITVQNPSFEIPNISPSTTSYRQPSYWVLESGSSTPLYVRGYGLVGWGPADPSNGNQRIRMSTAGIYQNTGVQIATGWTYTLSVDMAKPTGSTTEVSGRVELWSADSSTGGLKTQLSATGPIRVADLSDTEWRTFSTTVTAGPLSAGKYLVVRVKSDSDPIFIDNVVVTQEYIPPAPPLTGTLSGDITLGDFSGNASTCLLRVDLSPTTDGSPCTRKITITSNPGHYSITDIPAGTYDVAFSGARWLQRVSTGVVIPNGGEAVCNITLPNGDVDGNGTVNTSDFPDITAHLKAEPSSRNWYANADLDGNNSIDLGDFSIVDKNQGLTNENIAPYKKVIAWAVGAVDDIYLSQHVAELEQRPIDGVVIDLFNDGWSTNPLDRQHRNYHWGGSATFAVSDFTQVIQRLQACTFTKLTDNFFDFSTSAGGLKPSWFDSNWTSVVLNNLVVAATVARQVGFKGLFVDTESYWYSGQEGDLWRIPFTYNEYVEECNTYGVTPRTFAECKAKVKERGQETGYAITQAYPDIVLFFMEGIGNGESVGKDLLIPFIDGILSTAGPNVKIYDGGEHGYPQMRYPTFSRLRDTYEEYASVTSDDPSLYRKRMKYGFGVWVDAYPDAFGGFHTDDLTLNHKDGPGWEHTLYNALAASDKYAWIYTWHLRLWWAPSYPLGTETAHCVLCPHTAVPQPYLDAMANCKSPHDLNWTPLNADNNYYPPASQWPGYNDLTNMSNYDLVADLSGEAWKFFLDHESPFTGLYDVDDIFEPINTREFWQNQGYLYHSLGDLKGLGWYRCWFTVPTTLNGQSLQGRQFVLVFEGVAGRATPFLNRRQVDANDTVNGYAYGGVTIVNFEKWLWAQLNIHEGDSQLNMGQGWTQDVTFFIRPGEQHRLSMRVSNESGPGGIWKPIKLYVSRQ